MGFLILFGGSTTSASVQLKAIYSPMKVPKQMQVFFLSYFGNKTFP